MTKKVVLKLAVHDEKEKQKAMKAVSSISGIESLAIDMQEKKMTVIGNVDPVEVVNKLRKSYYPQILTVGPAKEPDKKDGDKKDDTAAKKDDTATQKDGDKKDNEKKSESEQIAELVKLYKNYNPHYTQYYHVYSAEENPNACVIS